VADDAKRDAARLSAPLAEWLARQNPQAKQVSVLSMTAPKDGASSETWMVDAAVSEDGARRTRRWVVRVEASVYQIYQDPSVERQFRVLETLGRVSDTPVPQALWFEPDPAVLGAPFFVMERIEGEVPPEAHHSAGVLAEAAPAAREAMWLSAIEAMARIHRVDPAPFAFLDRPGLGATGAEQEFAAWDDYRTWAGTPPHPTIERGRRWLDDNRPAQLPSGLAWGDARVGNIVFRDNAAQAILDWETASLGGAESDLGWWLYYEHAITAGAGIPRLEGIGGREETIAAWEHFVGRKAVALEWHEVFAAWRFAMIYERAVALNDASGLPHTRRGGDANPAIIRLCELIG
jgi:aminoglycoside phosphotransferase (APT) family kinase protein